jgi:hypothetical protein
MSTLFNFDLFSNPIAYAINLLMFWLFWPGGMFLAGWIGESRLVPLWRRQSKMFFPGELSLGVMTLSLLSMHVKIGSKTSILWLWWFCLIVVVKLVIFLSRRESSKRHRRPKARCSPTKLTYDVVEHIIKPTILIGLGLPLLGEGMHNNDILNLTYPYLWIFIGAFIFYSICAVCDFKHPISDENRYPVNWQPIWCQKKDLKH